MTPLCIVVAQLMKIELTDTSTNVCMLPRPDFSSFESSSINLQISRSKIAVFNVYRPPSSLTLSKPFSVFLEDFKSFLSFAATTPHEFVITSDFNIYLDNPTDHLTSVSISSLLFQSQSIREFSCPQQKNTFLTWS